MPVTKVAGLLGLVCVGFSLAFTAVPAARAGATVECRVSQAFFVTLAASGEEYFSGDYATVPADATVLDKTPPLIDPATGRYPAADVLPRGETWSVAHWGRWPETVPSPSSFPGPPPGTRADLWLLLVRAAGPQTPYFIPGGPGPRWTWTLTYSLPGSACPSGPGFATTTQVGASGTGTTPVAATTTTASSTAPENLLSGFEGFDQRLGDLKTQALRSSPEEWQTLVDDVRSSWFSLGADAPGAYGALHALSAAHNYLWAAQGDQALLPPAARRPKGQAARAEFLRAAAGQLRSAAEILHGTSGQNGYDVYTRLRFLAAEAESQAASAEHNTVSSELTKTRASQLDTAVAAAFGKLQPVFGVDASTVYGLYIEVESHLTPADILSSSQLQALTAAIAAERALEIKFLRAASAHR